MRLTVKCILFGVRLFLGVLFIYAAVPKILDPYAFAVDVYNYRMLPGFAVGIVAAGLPWIELIAGILLVAGIRTRAACLVVTGLLGIFTLALIINTLRGIDVDCGCFSAERSIGWFSAAEDAVLTLLGVWYLAKADSFLCLENAFLKGCRR